MTQQELAPPAATRRRTLVARAGALDTLHPPRRRVPNPEIAVMGMWNEFKAFLIKNNALALALAVVLGTALNDVVKGLVDNVIMPLVGFATPGGAWRTTVLNVGPVKFGVGPLGAAVLNFLIVGFLAWRLSKAFMEPDAEKPATKTCPVCFKSDLDARARRCPHCTSELGDPSDGIGIPAAGAARRAPAPGGGSGDLRRHDAGAVG
jgi:large conductance mechanosensitive channel